MSAPRISSSAARAATRSAGPNRFDPARSRLLHLLFLVSGAAALIYEVLWLRLFGDIFGATAEAATATLTAVFLGLALGSETLGRRADRMERPLRLYALLELGIPIAAILAYLLIAAYGSLYAGIYRVFGENLWLGSVVKSGLAALAVLPAATLMGGTLPALGRAIAGDPRTLGPSGARLYSVNIVGAVLGSVLAAFILPLALGVRGTYVLAMALNLLVAGGAGLLARDEPPLPRIGVAPDSAAPNPGSRHLMTVAFASGFLTIALQLLWTRMLALVVQNSVYTFGAIVATFLSGLAVGAAVAALLLPRLDAWRLMRISLLLTGILVALTPALFSALTGGLELFGATASWPVYSASIIGLAGAVVFLPMAAAGLVLPCVWELWRERPGAGTRLGHPGAVNTIGAILGPAVAGFVLLPTAGLGASIASIAALYVIVGELGLPASRRPRLGGWERAIYAPAVVLIVALAPPTELPVVRVGAGEEILWADEGARGAVAVVEEERRRRIKLDNHYALGGSHVAVEERRHGHLPLLLHPAPRDVAFIGLGTGITAGAAVSHGDLERVVIMELVPQIVQAAREYFRPWNLGVLDDPRVEVVTEDGRIHLAGSARSYDVIIGDLFVPWRAGVGALYTREHFLTVRKRLRPGGVFAQWLPLWQLSRREFEIILSTFLSAFDHVTLWRGLFNPSRPTVALVAHADGFRPIEPGPLQARLRRLRAADPFSDSFLQEVTGFLILYGGDPGHLEDRLAGVGINTENRPRIEWLAPRTQLAVQAGEAEWFTGTELAQFYQRLNQEMGSADDPLMSTQELPPATYRIAGAEFFHAEVLRALGRGAEARALRTRAYSRLRGGRP